MGTQSGVFIGILVVLIFAIIAIAGGLAHWSMQNNGSSGRVSKWHQRRSHCPKCPKCPKCPATCKPEDCKDKEYCPLDRSNGDSTTQTCQACGCDWTFADNCDSTTGTCFCGKGDPCTDSDKCVDGECSSEQSV
jgi:hypothetical protein